MNTTVEQNRAHRDDRVWIRSGSSVRHDGKLYRSEYTNVLTGWVIRKDWRMTGFDWHIFDASGRKVDAASSLTRAKFWAESALAEKA